MVDCLVQLLLHYWHWLRYWMTTQSWLYMKTIQMHQEFDCLTKHDLSEDSTDYEVVSGVTRLFEICYCWEIMTLILFLCLIGCCHITVEAFQVLVSTELAEHFRNVHLRKLNCKNFKDWPSTKIGTLKIFPLYSIPETESINSPSLFLPIGCCCFPDYWIAQFDVCIWFLKVCFGDLCLDRLWNKAWSNDLIL